MIENTRAYNPADIQSSMLVPWWPIQFSDLMEKLFTFGDVTSAVVGDAVFRETCPDIVLACPMWEQGLA